MLKQCSTYCTNCVVSIKTTTRPKIKAVKFQHAWPFTRPTKLPETMVQLPNFDWLLVSCIWCNNSDRCTAGLSWIKSLDRESRRNVHYKGGEVISVFANRIPKPKAVPMVQGEKASCCRDIYPHSAGRLWFRYLICRNGNVTRGYLPIRLCYFSRSVTLEMDEEEE